ncbi:hypothetical protein DRQ16_01835 [bacterium]|nr:MAG: hypothetical protein DRQ16_01835 [bacterium]
MRRKLIHLSSFLIPLLYYVIPPEWHPRLLLMGFTVIYITLDVLRLRIKKLRILFQRIFEGVIKPEERANLTAGTWLLVAADIAVILFPKEIAVLALAYTAIGDTSAYFIGKRYGKRKVLGKKTVEGTLGGLLANVLLALLFPGPKHVFLIGAVIASFSELLPLPPDDNFCIPLLSGGIMTLCSGITFSL